MLLRDELANLAWTVERRLESPMERGLDAASFDTAPLAAAGQGTLAVPEHQLSSRVPDH